MKKVLGSICIGVSILSLIYYLAINSISWTFNWIWLVIAGISAIIGLSLLETRFDITKYLPDKLLLGVKILIFIGIAIFLVVEGIIVYNGINKQYGESDYIVILGSGLIGDQPSKTLTHRLDEALEYHTQYPEKPIVVSGGQGPDEWISEAEAMRRYLVENDVPEELIIMEDKSTSTYENFKFTADILNELEEADEIKITIVTSNFHMYRSKYLANQFGLKAYGMPASAYKPLEVHYHVREFFAVIKDVIL